MRSLHVELSECPKKVVILLTLNFVTFWPENIHDDRQFADFNEVSHLEFMKRGQRKINLRAQQFYDGCFMCAHTCCILAQMYKHVMSHTASVHSKCVRTYNSHQKLLRVRASCFSVDLSS